MFDNQTELVEERRNNAIIIKECCIKFFVTFLLRNKKSIINK